MATVFSLGISEEVLGWEVTGTLLLLVGSRGQQVLLVNQPISLLKAGYWSLDIM